MSLNTPATSSAVLGQATPPIEFAWLELTNQCNLQCVHCYAESGPAGGRTDALTENDYIRVIGQLYALGCRKIQFIGGEPTLNRSLGVLIELARGMGFEFIEVFTNLIRLPDELLGVFSLFDVAVATSFYSHRSHVHDDITGQRGSFARTTRNIRRVLDAGLALRVSIIEMEQNAGDLAACRGFLEGLGVADIGSDRVREIGRADFDERSNMAELCGNCAGDVIAIGPDGSVTPCIMSKRWAVGSVLTDSLRSVVRSDRLSAVRAEIALATSAVRASCTPCAPSNPNCQPNCSPNAQCSPCSPKGGHKCQPNLWCRPAG